MIISSRSVIIAGVAGAIALSVGACSRTETPPPSPLAATSFAGASASPVVKPVAPAHLVAVAAPARVARKVSIVPVQADVKLRVKPLLNEGMNINVAADGFSSNEEFIAVAHTARNLEIPFMPLKAEVVAHHKTLAQAIHTFKPQVNSRHEADRADLEARSDLTLPKH